MSSYLHKCLLLTFIYLFTLLTPLQAEQDISLQNTTTSHNLNPQSNYHKIRIKNLKRFYDKLQSELDLLAHIQNLSDRKFITFGSARTRKTIKKEIEGVLQEVHYELAKDIFQAGEDMGTLAFENSLIVATGAGPGTMEVLPKGWIKAFIKNNIPDGANLQSLMNIVQNNPMPGESKQDILTMIEKVKKVKEKPNGKSEEIREWFANRVLFLTDMGLNPENLSIALSKDDSKYSKIQIDRAQRKLEISQKTHKMIKYLPKTNIKGMGTQGIKINLPFEATSNPFILEEYYFTLFFTRKLALLSKSVGAINFAPGFGTIDEVFDAWVRDVPMVFYGKYIWEPILNAWEKTFQEAGYSFPQNIIVTDDAEEGFNDVLKQAEVKFPNKTSYLDNVESTRNIQTEVDELFPRYMHTDPAIVFIGENPVKETEKHTENINKAKNISTHLLSQGYSVRIASEDLLKPIYETAKDLNIKDQLQLVLRNNGKKTDENEDLKDDIAQHQKYFETNHFLTHRIFSTENSIGYVFLPGGTDTINILFDILTRMQTGKIDKKPIVLIDPEFWWGTEQDPGIFRIIKQMSHDYAKKEEIFGVPLMLEKDFDLLKFAKNEAEALKYLSDYQNYSFEKDHKTEGFLDFWAKYIQTFTTAA